MSDVERPSDQGGGQNPGGSAHPHKLPARNMADIARLYLDGARPTNGPRRTPPSPPKPPAPATPRPAAKAAQRDVTRLPDEEPATAVLGLAAASDPALHWKLLTQAAQGLAAEQATSVAIVGLMHSPAGISFVADVVGVESTEELPVARTAADAAGQATADLQIARALHRLRPAVGLWIIAGPVPESRTFPAVASIARQWLLVCPTDNDGLVSSYQLLKQAFTRVEGSDSTRITPSVFLLSDDYAHAAVVHKRLRKAAHEFLRTDLALAGAGPIRGNGHEKQAVVLQPPIRVLSIACNAPDDALWAALLDELCPMTDGEEAAVPSDVESALRHVEDRAAGVAKAAEKSAAMAFDHLAQVLDPEERDALTAGLYDVPSPEIFPPSASTSVAETIANAGRPRSTREPVAPPPASTTAGGNAKDELKAEIAADRNNAMPVGPTLPAVQPLDARRSPILAHAVENGGRGVAQVASQKTNAESGVAPSLRALDMESQSPSRAAQWQAVERSIWDLAPNSALLDARPPMSWATETCIAIDQAGRLNVWTLYKEAAGGASWYALREWAREHKNLLALTRRDLTINVDVEVAVHIVLPLDVDVAATAREAKDPIPVLVRTPAENIHLYRLRTVQWDGRVGIIVVPAG